MNIKLLAVGTLAIASLGDAASSFRTKHPRVVVIGGGFAGLGAATTLQANGANVTLLEARDRMGGRAFTDMATFNMEDGGGVDMGAMWIHGIQNNAVYALAQKFGVETMYTDYDNLDYFSPNGTIVPDADIDPIYETMSDLINKIRNKADNDLSLG
eukprot:gene12876-11762_t